MKLIIYKFKDNFNKFVKKETLFDDIPTLGIAFTCIDNWCHDNNRIIENFSYINKEMDKISVKTKRTEIAEDDFDIIFDILEK